QGYCPVSYVTDTPESPQPLPKSAPRQANFFRWPTPLYSTWKDGLVTVLFFRKSKYSPAFAITCWRGKGRNAHVSSRYGHPTTESARASEASAVVRSSPADDDSSRRTTGPAYRPSHLRSRERSKSGCRIAAR